MFKNFILSIIGFAFLSTVGEMIIPENSIKKYFKLAMGFILMCILINPLTNSISKSNFEFTLNDEMSNEEIRANSDAYILKLHEENIKRRIEEICGANTESFIELFSDGTVKSVTLKGNIPENRIKQLKNELGCENIKLQNGDEHEN